MLTYNMAKVALVLVQFHAAYPLLVPLEMAKWGVSDHHT